MRNVAPGTTNGEDPAGLLGPIVVEVGPVGVGRAGVPRFGSVDEGQISSVDWRVEPSIAPWFSGKYTAKPSARSSSAGPTLVHQATLRRPVTAASFRS